MPAYSGIWTLSQQFQGRGQGLWPAVPGAPTIGTATAGTALCASVTFTAPACVGVPSPLTYTVTSTPGSVTTTGAASPLVVTGLTCSTAYTFRVKATNGTGTGPCSAASNSATALLASCATFTTPGTFSWVVPAGVTSAAMLAVGGGQGGGNPSYVAIGGRGGSLAYLNGRAVTPGTSYTVVVAAGLSGTTTTNPGAGNNSSVSISCTVILRATGGTNAASNLGTASYLGGSGNSYGGGGAAGYSGAGGNGASGNQPGCAAAASGGGAGGGAGGYDFCNPCSYGHTGGAGGGGVGLFGLGTTGAGGTFSAGTTSNGGGGGSGGTAGSNTIGSTGGRCGGTYGGGGGAGGFLTCATTFSTSYGPGASGAAGAVRIVWAGGPRGTPSFPSTNVGA